MSNDLALSTRSGLPDALRALVEDFPRTGWQTHPNFGGMVEFWLQRHLMFRQLLERLERDVQLRIDGHIDFDAYAPRLSQYGSTLLNELQGHHHIEDAHYFPRLMQLESRLEAGFGLLEADHQAMDGLLNGMAEAANRVLQGGEAGVFADWLEDFGGMLNRHLLDEEEIIVPVILKTGFDG